MSLSATADRPVAAARAEPTAGAPARWRLYLALAKPRIATMTVINALAGFVLGGGAFVSVEAAGLAAGVWLVAAACGALNQWVERDTDGLMKRTAKRPLPSKRLEPSAALAAGLTATAIGSGLMFAAGQPLAAGLGLATVLLYVAAYTPMKRHSVWCTAVGAIPGAMPPVLGYAAATGTLDATAFWLFAVFFLWQFPHFLAIAAMYRGQYADAGLKMSPDDRPRWGVTGAVAVATAALLLPAAAALFGRGGLGWVYLVSLTAVGLWYLAAAVSFANSRDDGRARKLLRVSLLYLPLWTVVAVADHLI